MPDTRIIGIVLVRNEDVHIRQSIENIVEFCDQIFVADHGSADQTFRIVEELAAKHPHIAARVIADPAESHAMIKGFAGTDSWIFGVDGDEIYDPAGLREMRNRILSGQYSNDWMLFGNVLNCDLLDPAEKSAAGYLSPPCRSITKLYNFRLLQSWDGKTEERLHGGAPVFRAGHDATARLSLHERTPWVESPLRCLHACFVRRSSLDPERPAIRENIMDQHCASLSTRLRRWWMKRKGEALDSEWKKSRYRRGERVTIDASPFFP